MNQDWDIKARADTCAACGQAFADGQEFISRLAFGAEGYLRSDLCIGCGEKVSAGHVLSTWKGVFKMPPPPPEEPLKKETAETLLRRFMEKEDFSRANAIYILSVMLERKRILVERDVQRRDDGTKVRVYEHRKTSETFVIPDPELRLDQLAPVQQEVIELLGGQAAADAPESAGGGAPEEGGSFPSPSPVPPEPNTG